MTSVAVHNKEAPFQGVQGLGFRQIDFLQPFQRNNTVTPPCRRVVILPIAKFSLVSEPLKVPLTLQRSPLKDDSWCESSSICNSHFNNRHPNLTLRRRYKGSTSNRITYNSPSASLDLLHTVFVHIGNIPRRDIFGIQLSLQTLVEILVCGLRRSTRASRIQRHRWLRFHTIMAA